MTPRKKISLVMVLFAFSLPVITLWMSAWARGMGMKVLRLVLDTGARFYIIRRNSLPCRAQVGKCDRFPIFKRIQAGWKCKLGSLYPQNTKRSWNRQDPTVQVDSTTAHDSDDRLGCNNGGGIYRSKITPGSCH